MTGPVLRFANQIAAQGYIVAAPACFHEFEYGSAPIPYDVKGTDAGNEYKVKKLLSATDEDIQKAIDTLMEHPNCNGRIGSTGMCYGGHLAFRVHLCSRPFLSSSSLHFLTLELTFPRRPTSRPQTALDPRCRAAVGYFPTDIHSASLSPDGDDSLERASRGEIKGEVALIFGTQDGHVVRPLPLLLPLSTMRTSTR